MPGASMLGAPASPSQLRSGAVPAEWQASVRGAPGGIGKGQSLARGRATSNQREAILCLELRD
jgi:hypothetical protein